MRIAVIGSGISGLSCAHYLSTAHEVSVFEADSRIGGHTATVDVQLGPRHYAIDTGFIVFNDWTYPNFIALMDELGVSSKATEMGFSVHDEQTGLEYSGTNLNTLFAQRGNLISPRFLRMVRDILRFNKQSVIDLESGRLNDEETLGSYLQRNRYSEAFQRQYLVAMGSAIWSADCDTILDFPLSFFLRFFRNHGLLSVADRPQWRVIEGGSREYLRALCQRFEKRIHTSSPIKRILREPQQVQLEMADGRLLPFDQVVIATHSDQALALLDRPSDAEREVLGALPYQDNDVVLHTDTRLLPQNRKTWSSWNYNLGENKQQAVVTYNMNILQGLDAPETFCVTLNNTAAINPHKILGRFNYSHPVFSLAGISAQKRWSEVNGTHNTWYCGAYWHNGFHEDGVVSALRVADALNANGAASGSVKSRIYEGLVKHRRLTPRRHEFSYRVFMPYINLDELPELFDRRWLWSARGRALAQFRRSDFLGDPALPLKDEVRRRIREETGCEHSGPIYLLANLRYFGFNMNPIACYYCFSENEQRLEYLVAEVNNTPWDERHSYVLQGPETGAWLRTDFDKKLHVSPFNPMEMLYHWRSNTPDDRLVLHLANSSDGERVFDASLSLSARPMTGANLNRALWRYPLMTARIALAIYWQALRLFFKRVPLHDHPRTNASGV